LATAGDEVAGWEAFELVLAVALAKRAAIRVRAARPAFVAGSCVTWVTVTRPGASGAGQAGLYGVPAETYRIARPVPKAARQRYPEATAQQISATSWIASA